MPWCREKGPVRLCGPQLAEAKQGFLGRKKEGDETAQSWLDETEAVIRQLLERE